MFFVSIFLVIRVDDVEAKAFETLLSFLCNDWNFQGGRQSAMNEHLICKFLSVPFPLCVYSDFTCEVVQFSFLVCGCQFLANKGSEIYSSGVCVHFCILQRRMQRALLCRDAFVECTRSVLCLHTLTGNAAPVGFSLQYKTVHLYIDIGNCICILVCVNGVLFI